MAAFTGMEIGPVRRRFTAEPASSPVPGEATPVHEPAAQDRAAQDRGLQEPAPVTAPTTSARPDRVS